MSSFFYLHRPHYYVSYVCNCIVYKYKALDLVFILSKSDFSIINVMARWSVGETEKYKRVMCRMYLLLYV